MLFRICNTICDHFAESNIISEHNKALYVYGLHQATIMIINIALTLLIGCILDMIWQSILFLLTYIPVRTYAGGYHAKTPLRCYCLSVILIFAILLVMKEVYIPSLICMIGITLSSICILLFAPVQDPNKPFTEKEKLHFKKQTRILLLIELIICTFSFVFNFSMVYTCIFMSLSTVSLMLLLGKTKNHFVEKN